MSYTTINKSTDYFNTLTFTGTGSAGTRTGVGFTPDMFWHKNRGSIQSHGIIDVIRGNGNYIVPNANSAQNNDVGAYGIATDGYTFPNGDSFFNSGEMVYWNWKAGTSVSGNSGGSGSPKSYTGSVNATAGFSIIKYIGNGTSGQQIPHHLGAIAGMVIRKKLDSSDAWNVWHTKIGNSSKALYLNTTNAIDTNTNYGTSVPSSSVFYNGSDSMINANGTTYIAYCFAEKQGYSKFGSYTGNGNADGTFVYTGFKPAFVLAKKTNEANTSWIMLDNKRANSFNPIGVRLFANLNAAENTSSPYCDFLSNGFKFKTTDNNANDANDNYIYMAFAEAPLVGTNNVPATAR